MKKNVLILVFIVFIVSSCNSLSSPLIASKNTVPPNIPEPDSSLSFSSEKAKVLFGVRNLTNSQLPTGLYIMNFNGSNISEITIDNNLIFMGEISPRGDKVAVLSGSYATNSLVLTFIKEGGKRITIPLGNITGSATDLLKWSPDDDELLFIGNDDIYIINSDGTGIRDLTNSPEWVDSNPVWSPDGKKIAYVSYSSGIDNNYNYMNDGSLYKDRIYIMDSNGENNQILSDLPRSTLEIGGINTLVISESPSFSPDGKYIAFISNYESGNEGVYVINIDTEEIKPLLIKEQGYSIDYYYFTSWSPNSNLIMVGVYAINPGINILYLLDAGGNSITKIIESSQLNLAYTYPPQWSSDGKWIAFLKGGGEDNIEQQGIYVIRPDGRDLTLLSDSSAMNVTQFSWATNNQ